MLGRVKLDNILLTYDKSNFNKITTRSRSRTLIKVVRDTCTNTVQPVLPIVPSKSQGLLPILALDSSTHPLEKDLEVPIYTGAPIHVSGSTRQRGNCSSIHPSSLKPTVSTLLCYWVNQVSSKRVRLVAAQGLDHFNQISRKSTIITNSCPEAMGDQ